jgi:hypothetical protein
VVLMAVTWLDGRWAGDRAGGYELRCELLEAVGWAHVER